MTDGIVAQFLWETSVPARAGIQSDVLVAESNHRIANNLAMIAALSRLQAAELAQAQRSLEPDEAGAMSRELSARIETVSRLHRLLSETPSGSAPELGPYLCDVALSAVASMAGSRSAPRFSAELRGGA